MVEWDSYLFENRATKSLLFQEDKQFWVHNCSWRAEQSVNTGNFSDLIKQRICLYFGINYVILVYIL